MLLKQFNDWIKRSKTHFSQESPLLDSIWVALDTSGMEDKMQSLVVLCSLLAVVASEDAAWSTPTVSTDDCTSDYTGAKHDWFCDWTSNSGLYHQYFNTHPYPSIESVYSSYISDMPPKVYGMLQNTLDVINGCSAYIRHLQVSNWLDIPYICPGIATSWNWYQADYGSSYYLSFSDSSCQNFQTWFCGGITQNSYIFPHQTSSSYYAPRPTTMSTSRYNALAYVMAHFYHDSYRFNNPSDQSWNGLTSLYADHLVSSMYDCQRALWETVAKIDCSYIFSMLGNLRYPDYSHSAKYATIYQHYETYEYNSLCWLVVEEVYKQFVLKIGQAVEYVAASTSPRPVCLSDHSTTPFTAEMITHRPTRRQYETTQPHIYKRTTQRPYHDTSRYPPFFTTYFPRYPTLTTPGSKTTPVDSDGGGTFDGRRVVYVDDGLSEWVIILLGVIGVLGFLAFCALLFYLIFRMYTHENRPLSGSTATASYATGRNDEVRISTVDESVRDKEKGSSTPPPAYDRIPEKRTSVETDK